MPDSTDPIEERTAFEKFTSLLKVIEASVGFLVAKTIKEHVQDIIKEHETQVNEYLTKETHRLLQYTTCTTCYLKTAIMLSGDKREPLCRECSAKGFSRSPSGWSYYRGKLSTD